MSREIHSDHLVSLHRGERGVITVKADGELGIYRGLGIAHATDRALQMLMTRILARGRCAELLDPKLVDVDLFFRKMNWHSDLKRETAGLSADARDRLDAYVVGVNLVLSRSVPWELRVLGYRPEPWTIEDIVLVSRMIGYVTLAQSQGELERWIVECVHAGVGAEHLEALFPGQLAGLDPELLKKTRLTDRLVPDAVRTLASHTRLMSSNNWVVAGRRTRSGQPLLANDPHLEINRLPAVWYEVVVETPERYAVSATIPGLCGLLLARTNDLAWGATYSFADATDSWVERVKDGSVLREKQWAPLRQRVEVVRRKGKEPLTVTFWDTDNHGVLDGAPEDGEYQLATRWAGAHGGARSIEAMFALWNAKTVAEGMRHLGDLEVSFNFVLADSSGGIGYQMSGRIPVRRPGLSGLIPLPGWDSRNDWQGFHASADLPRVENPESGFIVTANDDLNHLGVVSPINAPMASYRADRISELLGTADQLDAEDMKRIQHDVYSKQAQRFVEIARPFLPDTADGRAIGDWNFEYDARSEGAEAFERFYAKLVELVFGPVLGAETVDFLLAQTGILTDFYANFDRVLLSERSPWFGGKTREEVFAAAASAALTGRPVPWGQRRGVVLSHMLFGGKLPRLAGFDRGPVTLVGGRATPHQGQIYRSAGRLTTFAPSYRMVTDFAVPGWESCLAGGPSDRRFSRWYYSEMNDWIHGRYKRIGPIRP
ncbi:penicillin acylase family protein [Allokutzneria sp. A3M-2-11 16]|uniref:penicillin acylase family protein n=1 Tax=Allokutzneria sp. A3M-2-11 16 TaxID=2962043 RepID=UPI0020B7A4DB|nr:penicillin acylase family protein [Allokutzneria sp. A3M-2-11 16]MCP3803820.1 penicillin acylase family protein [Allokutzneria sp. A3M-2-11 16]